MAITEADVQTRLHALIDPNTGKDFVTGKAAKKIRIGAGDIVARADAALAAGVITQAQADQFRRDGALGSHLEILERNDGFKGFKIIIPIGITWGLGPVDEITVHFQGVGPQSMCHQLDRQTF